MWDTVTIKGNGTENSLTIGSAGSRIKLEGWVPKYEIKDGATLYAHFKKFQGTPKWLEITNGSTLDAQLGGDGFSGNDGDNITVDVGDDSNFILRMGRDTTSGSNSSMTLILDNTASFSLLSTSGTTHTLTSLTVKSELDVVANKMVTKQIFTKTGVNITTFAYESLGDVYKRSTEAITAENYTQHYGEYYVNDDYTVTYVGIEGCMYSSASDFTWADGAAMDDNATFASGDNMVFANTNAITATVNTAITAGDVYVGDGSTVVLSGEGSLTADSLNLVESAKFSLNTTGNSITTLKADDASTLIIANGVEQTYNSLNIDSEKNKFNLVISGKGTVVTSNSTGSAAFHQGNIMIQDGGTLELKSNDNLGWSTTSTKAITLLGSSESKRATLALWGRQTMTTDLYMQGNSIVTSNGNGTGDNQPGINAYKTNGAVINVQGVDNTIAAALHTRDSFHITVADGGELLVSGQVRAVGNGSNGYGDGKNPNGYEIGSVVKLGAGSITFTNAANTFAKKYFNMGGDTVFSRDGDTTTTHTFSNGIQISGGKVIFDKGVGISLTGNINIASEGTLCIKSMKDTATVSGLLTSTTGTGTIELSQSAHLMDGNAMAFEGELTIKSGGDLRLGIAGEGGGHAYKATIDLSSLSQVNLAGGTLSMRAFAGNVGNVKVSQNSTLFVVDCSVTDGKKDQQIINSLELDADLELRAQWKTNIIVNSLSGSEDLTFTAAAQDSQNRDLTINSVNGFTGNFTIDNYSGNKANVKFTIKDGESLNASQITASANSSVVIDGAGIYNMGNQTYIAKAGTVEKGSFADTWEGKVTFTKATLSNADLSMYGNANSTISFSEVKGSLASQTISTNIELASSGISCFDWTSDSAANLTYAGKISGGGNMGTANGTGHKITFTGDVSEWTGVYWASRASEITYSGNANIISNRVSAGDNYESSVTYENTNGMTVKGSINNELWSRGTLNLEVVNAKNATGGAVEFTGAVGMGEKNPTTNLNVGTGASAVFSNASVKLNDILLNAQAQLSFTAKESLSVSKLEMQQGAEVSVSKEGAVGTLTVNTAATFNGGNVNANLTLADNATVTINSAVALGSGTQQQNQVLLSGDSTVTGYTLSLGTQLTLQGNILEQFDASAPGSGEVILFRGVDTLNLGGVEYNALSAADGVKLSDYFRSDSVNFDDYYIGFNEHGDVYAGLIVPEPATATLSLLALAGLCARRRRASR